MPFGFRGYNFVGIFLRVEIGFRTELPEVILHALLFEVSASFVVQMLLLPSVLWAAQIVWWTFGIPPANKSICKRICIVSAWMSGSSLYNQLSPRIFMIGGSGLRNSLQMLARPLFSQISLTSF